MHRIVRRATLLAAALLAGCVYLPRTTAHYDPQCQVVNKRIELEPVQLAAIGGCSNAGCAALLVAAGVTAVASAVVSGSVMVVGNAVHWLERQGQCRFASPKEDLP